MKEKIFASWCNFNFIRNDIEHDYQIQKDKKLNKFNLIIITFCLVASIADTIINSFFLYEYDSFLFRVVLFSSYVVSGIMIILTFISCFCKNIKVLKCINYFNYYLLFYILFDFRYPFIRILMTDHIFFYFILILEIFIRMIWNLLGLFGFMESLILNFISISTMWILYAPMLPQEIFFSAMMNFVAYSFAMLVNILVSYILEKQQRKAFFYHWKSDKKAKWLSNILETMNAGFLSIKGGKVVYINSFLLCLINKIRRRRVTNVNLITERTEDSQTNFINRNGEDDGVVRNLISEFKAELNSQPSEENCLKIFTKYISQIPEINNFKLIGDKVVELEDSELSFEIQCRYNKSETEEGELEFLLNDVTRTKLKEIEIAEFKYKTLFFSKVAHEFKNPLICITELMNQVHDDMETQKLNDSQKLDESNLINTFTHIKSLSNFLIVLLRDLNYFSECQTENNIAINKQEINLEEIVQFCKLITESLIKKNNKSQAIEFLSIINENVPIKIITDASRLEQVLINLLSNSVKFTLFGHIVLEVSTEWKNEKEMIKFLVKDTGVGMKEEQQKRLFIPVSKEFKNYNNEMGSGLGLNIANEIAKKLGEENIQFHSEYERGSSFWFYVNNSPIKNEEEEREIFISDNFNNLRQEFSKNEIEIIPNEERKIILNSSSISISSSKTEQKDFDPSKVKSATDNNLFRKRIININENKYDNDSKHSGEQSESINFKYKTVELKRVNISPISIKDEIKIKFSINDFITNDLNKLRKAENVTQSKFYLNHDIDNKEEILNQSNVLNVLVVDDEEMTRQSIIRILNNVSKELNIKINIIEAEDGVESIYIVYKATTQGIKISLIFSDETMHYINGSRSSEIIKEILHKKNINEIPFYLVTAFEENLIKKYVSNSIKMIISKPLTKCVAKKIIYEKANNIGNAVLI